MAAPLIVEIAVQDALGARVALTEGADRVELCQALETGGLTPSLGLIDAVADAVDPSRVNVLVRPRPGGFVYSPEEIAVVSADIATCVARGVGGVVVGALTADGALDREAIRRWQDAAGSATVVFHRAIDAAPHPFDVFDALVEQRIPRVLTSGGAARSVDGLQSLEAFVTRGNGAIEVMAGGGVRPVDVPLLRRAGLPAVHLSARVRVGVEAASGPGGGAGGYDATSARIVGEAVAAARA
ncbi:copper homeostasis protein CutC [Microbacterium koreense]|uniref:PF03932 family protein CutC n=1 Tax=Microbacterium koreense TaxID=323761 RepID=A0ABW2ZRK4_9MICO